MDLTMGLAIYGAALSTVIFVWEIIKYVRDKPRISVVAKPNMQGIYDYKPTEEERKQAWILAQVTNISDKPVVLTHFYLEWYAGRCAKFLNRGKKSFFVKPPVSGTGALPAELSPSQQWTGLANQDEEADRLLKSGILLACVATSTGKRAVRVRVK
jgi:hypothetical protein